MTLRQRWPLKALLSFIILEVGLYFVPLPDWWETAVFADYLYSTRIMKALDIENQYNSMGYRDTEWRQGERSIAFLGDSRTFGLFVEREETYAEAVERMGDWQSLNLGVPGATTFEALDSLVPDALNYEPFAAVVCLDINSSLIGYVPRAQASRRSDVLSNLVRSFSTWIFLEGAWHSFFSDRVPIIPLDDYEMQLDLVFQQLSEGGVEQNILVVGWTELEDYPDLYTKATYDRYRERSRVVAQRRGIPILEFTEVLKQLPVEDAYIGEHNIHLSPRGHHKLAQAIVSTLNAQ